MNILSINTDSYFYDYINSISDDKICSLVPNHITIINFIFSLYIIYSISKRKYNLYVFLLLIFIRICLDCLDGAVARKCNKTSEFGKYLDVIGDTIFYIVLMILLYSNIKTKYKSIKNIIIVAIILNLYGGYSALFKDYEIYRKNNLGNFMYNNTIILNMVGFYVYYQLLDNK